MMTFELPAFVKITPRTLVFPTLTLPKTRFDALEVRTAVDAMPIPRSDTVLGVVETLFVIAT